MYPISHLLILELIIHPHGTRNPINHLCPLLVILFLNDYFLVELLTQEHLIPDPFLVLKLFTIDLAEL